MYIAVCDNHAEEPAFAARLLSLWQQARNIPLHFKLFRSAAEILDAAEKEPFTLYLLPGIDGIAAAREVRAIDEQRNGLCSFEAEIGIFTLRVMLPAGRSR